MRRWSNPSLKPPYCILEDHAQSGCSLSFASLLPGLGLFFAVVCLIGCNGLASPNSLRITTANLSVGAAQGGYGTTSGQLPGGLTPNPVTPAPSMLLSPAPLQIMTDALPDGTIQGNYTTRLVATGGVPPYSWDATAGQIAPGLTLRSSSGTISGIPFAAGAFIFTARVQDSTGSSLSTNLSLNISPAPSPTVSDAMPGTGSVDGGIVVMISDRSRIPR